MSDLRLRKDERLKSRKAIQQLFVKGQNAYKFPVNIRWATSPSGQTFPARAGFSVPRKKFKRAVDRNLLKRRLREAYRLNKSSLYDALQREDKQISLMLIYTHSEILPFDTIQEGVVKALESITRALHAAE